MSLADDRRPMTDDGGSMAITRRIFLKGGAMAIIGSAAIPSFLTRAVYAAETTAGARRKRQVVVFQRGAADDPVLVARDEQMMCVVVQAGRRQPVGDEEACNRVDVAPERRIDQQAHRRRSRSRCAVGRRPSVPTAAILLVRASWASRSVSLASIWLMASARSENSSRYLRTG